MLLGGLRSRLMGGGASRWLPMDGRERNLRIPIGRNRGEDVIVDLASPEELDTFEEVLIRRIYPLGMVTRAPAMIVDCGANVGFFASLCRVHFPNARVVCWEPDLHNFRRLTAQPLLQAGIVQCHQRAVSNFDGELFLTGQGVGCQVGLGERGDGRIVETCNLGAWMTKNLECPAIVKIDIEGHESVVIEGLDHVWKGPCTLFLETHANAGRDDETIERLAGIGFRMKLLRVHEVAGDPRVFKEYFGQIGD